MRHANRWLIAALIVQLIFGWLFLKIECQESLRQKAEAELRQRAAEADPDEGLFFQNVDIAWSTPFRLFALAILLLFCAAPAAPVLALYRGSRLERLAAGALLASWMVLLVLLPKSASIRIPAEFCSGSIVFSKLDEPDQVGTQLLATAY